MNNFKNKVVINILQGNVLTLTVLDELTINPLVTNFLQCIMAKKYDKDKVIAIIV